MTKQGFDRDAALGRVGDDVELLKEIAGLFLEDESNLTQAIEQAIASGDAKALERAAHTLKGCVSNFGAGDTYEAALNLEKMGRAADFSRAPDGMRTVKSALVHLRQELRAFLDEE